MQERILVCATPSQAAKIMAAPEQYLDGLTQEEVARLEYCHYTDTLFPNLAASSPEEVTPAMMTQSKLTLKERIYAMLPWTRKVERAPILARTPAWDIPDRVYYTGQLWQNDDSGGSLVDDVDRIENLLMRMGVPDIRFVDLSK